MSDIFISYASEDRPRAAKIAQALESEGWSVWWDRNIRTGTRFSEVIEAEIRKARCVVVLWSTVSVSRDWVVEEASEGKRRQVLAPILIENVQPPWGFRLVQTADLSHWRGDPGDAVFRRLCQDLSELLGPASKPPEEIQPPEKPKPHSVLLPSTEDPARRHMWVWGAWSLQPRNWVSAAGLVVALAGVGLAIFTQPWGRKGTTSAPTQGQTLAITAPRTDPKAQVETPPTSLPATKEQPAIAAPERTKKDAPARTSPATQDRPATRTNPKDGLAYVFIPAGTFTMGCSPEDSECDSDEKPPHAVQIASGFWLGQTEVTQAAWKKVMNSDPSHFTGDQLPIESVDWTQAGDYCKAIGGRLPTEQEWEYAARAGTTGPRYGPIDSVAWYSGNSVRTTHPVGLKQANAFGLFDMLGNVWEWTASNYDVAGQQKVVRVGSWVDDSRGVRASYRLGLGPAERFASLGFRCVGEFR